VTLSALASINTGPVLLESDGTGSSLNIAALSSFAAQASTWTDSTLQLSNGGSAIDAGLASLTDVDINIGASEAVTLSTVTTYNGGNIAVNGGGTLSLPGVTSYMGHTGFANTLEATGTSSSLSLANLTTVTVTAATFGSHVDIEALAGSTLNLSSLASFTSGGGGITLGSGGSLHYGSNLFALPSPGNGLTINVPQLPPGVPVYLGTSGTFSGGTTFNLAAGDDIALTGGTFTSGVTFNLGASAIVDLTGGNTVTYSGLLTGSGGGTVQLSSGIFYPGLGGVTLNFTGSMFQWTGGSVEASVGNVTNLGTINLSGGNQKEIYADGTLDNFGTMIQTGGGNFGLHSDNISPTTLIIEPGASYVLESDAGINNTGLGDNVVFNRGTIRKTMGSGTSTLFIPSQGYLNNSGTIEADTGTVFVDAVTISQLSGTTLLAGTWNALGGAALQFPSGVNITSDEANVTLAGSGATFAALAGLAANSGSFSLINGANFTAAGSLTNSGTLTVGAGSTLTIPSSFTQTPTGTLNEQIGGAPGSGQYGQVKVAGAGTLAGQFGLGLVNGFTALVGQAFQPLTFGSVTGGFSNFTGLAPTFTQALNATSLILTATNTSVDLDLTSVTAPTSATAGQSITVTWQVSNLTNLAFTGSWLDSIYLSPTLSLTNSSILLASKQENGVASNGSYGASLAVPLTNVPPGFYYVLVKVDSLYQVPDPNRGNNVVAASGQINVSLPALALGTPASGSFSAADQDHYYQVTVPAGGALTVTLTSAVSSGALALYIGQGTLPTAANNQGAAAIANQPNQLLTVPQVLNAGTYYILVHSTSGAAAMANYMLTVSQSSALAITAISSYAGGNGGNVTIEIDGTNFTSAATASLTLGGNTINASAIDFVSAAQIYATFNLTGAALGNYTLKVQQGASSATAATPFAVVTANNGSLQVVLTGPQYVRSGRTGPITVTYTNTSNNDIIAPLLELTSSNPSVAFSTPDDPNHFVQASRILAVATNGPAGTLRPGQSGILTLTLLSNDTINGDTIPVTVSKVQAGQIISWSAQESALRPSRISAAAWNVIWPNFISTVGTTSDSLDAALSKAATYLSNLGENTAEVGNVNRLLGFILSQANGSYPVQPLTSAVDASLRVPGHLSLAIDRTFAPSIAGRYQPGIFGVGWSTSWQSSLTVDSAGNVTISRGGAIGFFVAQPNGTYLDTAGEYGVLAQSGGLFNYTSPGGTQSVFLANGNLNYQQDTDGNRISLGYNASNELVSLTFSNPGDPSEPTEQLTLTYNGQGFASQVADGTGNTWSYTYDSAGHLLSMTAPGNLTTNYTYDTGTNAETVNALLSITRPDGSQRSFTYDPSTGRLTGTSQNGGANAITYTYVTEAEVAAKDANGDTTTVWFNDLGLAARIQDPLGAVSSYQFDANGNRISHTNAAGQTYQYAYDGNGNLTQIINPLGQSVAMSYGPLNNLSSITDAAGNTTQYAYDASGNLRSITYPDGTTQSFTYDPLGNMSQAVLQNGDPIAYQYNALGLVTSETLADGSTRTFTYDAHGNLLTATDSTGTTTLAYNAANQLTSITYPNGLALAFTYNTQGQRIKSVDQSGFTVNYSYDSLGRLSKLTDVSGNLIVQYTYNNLGQLTRKDNGNGTYTTYSYDSAGNMLSIVNFAGGTTVNSSFTYTYNLLGEVTSVTDNTGSTTTYAYDPTGQLTQVNRPGGQTITYVYNAAGDRTDVVVNITPNSWSSNGDNEITRVGSTSYFYDANGNLHAISDASGTTTYNFNDWNQLISIAAPDGTTARFQYSPLGFMVGTTMSNGSTTNQTNYLVDPTGLGNVVGAFTGNGSLIAHYTFGLGLVNQTGPGGTGYYDFDHSSNTAGITGTSGTYVNQYTYLPFGETTTVASNLPNPFTFGGQLGIMQTGNNLFSMRAREYTPMTAQFLSNDPLGLGGGDSNLRRYVFNDPVQAADPSGKYDGGDFAGDFAEHAANAALDEATGGFGGAFGAAFASIGAEMSMIWNGIAAFAASGLKSRDPNALVGPAGFGAQGFIQPTGSWTYTVQFENDGSVAAQDVSVSEQLDANLNWSTFQLGSFGFGSINISIPAGLTHYQTSVAYQNTDGTPLDVQVTIDFNVQTGLLTATFVSLDPKTGQAPTGVFDGFLPPDNSAHIGEGFIQYTVQPKSGLSQGTAINQQAAVVFDTNAPLNTAVYTNAIDVTPPTSTVTALPANVPPTLTVSWSGSDPNGPGIASYNIYVSDNGGPFTLWLAATPQTSASFSGQGGHTYGFYSVASDGVLQQATPTQAQATTTTYAYPPPTSSVAALPSTEFPTFTVSWSGSDPNGPGIASYNIYVSDDGGPFTLWQSATTQTSATFTGQGGHTYGFYSVATDNVGIVQPTPTQAQASTTVVQSITISGTVFQDINSNGVQDPGEPGIAGQTLFLDLAGTGQLQAGDPIAVTDANGNFQFTISSPSTYTILPVLLGGMLLGAPSGGSIQVNVSNAVGIPGQNFAELPTSIAVPLTLPPSTPFPAQGNATTDYVEALYRSILDRNADAGGLANWTNLLNRGTLSRLQVVQAIRQSLEHFTQEVTDFYFTFLGRAPDAGGLQGWVQNLENGLPEEKMAFYFLDSPEYLSKGDKYFIDHMYDSILGRGFDAAGEASWLNVLGDDATGAPTHPASLTHEQVITSFLYSPESLTRLVEGYYQVYLQRLADPGGLSNWVNALQQGGSFLTIGQQFLASQEFFNRAAAEG
jgi:RHS repeat-associated protein